MKLIHAEIAECQRNLDAARKGLREAVADLDADDQAILHLRAEMRSLFKKLRELDFEMLRR